MIHNQLLMLGNEQKKFNELLNHKKTTTNFYIALLMELAELMQHDPKCKIWIKNKKWDIKNASIELADIWIFLFGMPIVHDNKELLGRMSYLLERFETSHPSFADPEKYRLNAYLNLNYTIISERPSSFALNLTLLTIALLKEWNLNWIDFFQVIEKKSTYNLTRKNFKFKNKNERK